MMKGLNTDLFKSVTRIDHCLVIALPTEITDDSIKDIAHTVTTCAYDSSITGAILNFSMTSTMDSYIFSEILKISRSVDLMGVEVVWVGLSPGVVCALVDLNVAFEDKAIRTAPNLDQGLALLADSQ